MNVLVTGGAGYVGQHLITQLINNGNDVVAIARKPIDYSHPNFKFVQADLCCLSDVIKDSCFDVLFHTAARINLNDTYESISEITNDNILASFEIADFAVKNGIKKVILSSTCSVYKQNYDIACQISEIHKLRPWNLYAMSKLTSEWIFQNKLAGFVPELVILRYSSIYGAGQRQDSLIPILINKAASNGEMELFGSGKRIQDYIYIDDVISANISCMQKQFPFGTIFNVGSGEKITDLRLARSIKSIWNSTSDIVIKDINLKPESYFNYSIEKAKKSFDFKPISIMEGLTRYKLLYKER